MIGLVPRDHWEHKISDLLLGITRAMLKRKDSERLYIDGLGNCLPVRSGRTGLVLALRALNLPPGARIGVPLYCCPVVFKAIKSAGCIPCFIDIDSKTFCISPEDLSKKSSNIDAVIAVHMFGNLCDIKGLKEAAQDKPIIEDCAQSLGSKINGKLAGSFGDIAFFSFRSGKYLSVGEGGALFSSNQNTMLRLSQIISSMPISGYGKECSHILKVYIKSLLRSKPLYGFFGYHLWNIANKRLNLSEKSDVSMYQIYKTDFTIIKKRLKFINLLIEKQRTTANYYSQNLKLDSNMICSEAQGTYCNRYHYPITFPSTDTRDFIADYLFRRKIDTIKYLDDIVRIATEIYGYADNCPLAEQLSKKVLIVPNYHNLMEKDIQHIVRHLNIGWTKITGSYKAHL